jgi:hypothetical protein
VLRLGKQTVKSEAVGAILPEMKLRLKTIMASPFLTVQKIDAVTTVLVPAFDFIFGEW